MKGVYETILWFILFTNIKNDSILPRQWYNQQHSSVSVSVIDEYRTNKREMEKDLMSVLSGSTGRLKWESET